MIPSDIEIAKCAKMLPITEVAQQLGLTEDDIESYGKYKAKLGLHAFDRLKDKSDGKLILVTAINPTPAGEGKTTTTVGLGQAFAKIGKKAIIALREPSLGPVFGVKGGAAGGGYSQVVPMEDINLHFTGDIHAVTSANNLLSAMLDNHIQQGNELDIDIKRITWKRVLDMNDRALRGCVVGLGGKVDGIPRQEGFMITVASEIMAVLCLSNGIEDLKVRLGRMVVAYTRHGEPVTASDLKAEGSLTLLLKDAIKPNLVQTVENTPCLMHGGPFANIAHGCNSLMATRFGLKLADYCITEAGFGADLGGEKFMDIKCRYGGLKPQAAVIVATVRALKYNGGVPVKELNAENVEALKKGIVNLEKHVENINGFGVPVIVALNRFHSDTPDEVAFIKQYCKKIGVDCIDSEVFAKGGEGGIAIAEKLVELTGNAEVEYTPAYELDLPIRDKVNAIVTKIYGGKQAWFTPEASKEIDWMEKNGFGNLPICMAKTQYSLSDNPTKLGRPKDFDITVREVRLSAGAGFIVAITGDIMLMPGLPKSPAAERMDIDSDGDITGLF